MQDNLYGTSVRIKSKMNNTFRFTSFKEAVNHLMDHCNLSNQEATHFIWDNQFTMGTDRAIWLSIPVDFGC